MKYESKKFKLGSRHILSSYGREKEFEWVGTGWSTPGTVYNTKDSAMQALGWKYIRPIVLEEIN